MANQSIYYVVDKFREYLRQTSDDSVYTDEFLYSILIQCRAELIKQLIDDNKELSPWLYQRFCIKLCPSTFIECNCAPIDFGCTVWKSEQPIPEFIKGANNLILNISELYGDHINMVTERSNRTVNLRKYKNDFYYLLAESQNNIHLYLLSSSNKIPPKFIKGEGILADPSEVDVFNCEDCFDVIGTGFNLELSRHNAMFKMAVEMLSITFKMPEDRSNNTESTHINNQI